MKLLYTAALSALLFTSCNKYLDVKPKGKLIPSTVADFDHLLDNVNIVQFTFLDNNTGCMLAYLTDNVELSEGLGKISYLANNHPNLDRYYAYIYRPPFKNPATSDYFWDWGTYRAAGYFNNVIDGVKASVTADTEAYAKGVTAQALIGRAWAYFNTTLVYGPAYVPGGKNDTKTIPYVTSSDAGAAAPNLSTQAETFARVLQDLYDALPDAPLKTNYPSRPNKTAAYALLANIHLFTQKYDSVAYYANLAWTAAIANGEDKVLYDYNRFSWKEPANLVNSGINAEDLLLAQPNSKEILLFRSADAGTGRTGSAYPSAELIALYDQQNDLRYTYFYLPAPGYKATFNNVLYDDGIRVQNFRGSKSQLTSGLTYPEVLLLRAEGYARTNRPALAIADLNTLRKYRFKTGTPQLSETGLSADQVIQAVLDERRRELPIGSIKRFLDLKRFSLEPGKPWSKAKIVHKIGNETFEGTVNSGTFILPISNAILKFNPGWGIPLDTRPF
jgi:hypothetical protein